MKSGKAFISFRSHPLIRLLSEAKGNAKTLILIEPLWGIPESLIAPFATLYMVAMGVTDVQIGLILSVSMVVQVAFSFAGGILADKLGRKTTTMLGDLLGWGVACMIWAVSQNFWFFLIAVLMNSFEQINQTAWHCLLIEDAEEKHILNIYTWITIGGLVSVFFAPISGILIDKFSLVPVIRTLYVIFAVTMMLKSYITWRYTSETRQGAVRRREAKNTSIRQMIAGYRELVPQILRNRGSIQTLLIMAIVLITNTVNSSFFGLYVTTRLMIPERYLAFFPILRAAVMLVFLFVFQHRLQCISFKFPMQIGLLLYVISQALLIFSPEGQLFPIILFVLLEAVANAIVAPRREAMQAVNVDPQERARIVALMVSLTIAFSSPFGYFAGFLSSINRQLPFVLCAVLYIAAMLVIARYREPAEQ